MSRTETEAPSTPPSARRGRPRDSALDAEILDAAVDELIAHGFAGLTIEAVAQRAGVARTTVYRRWSDTSELALAAARHVKSDATTPPPGTVREQLGWLLEIMAAQWSEPRWVAVMRRVAADGTTYPELYDEHRTRLITPHVELLRSILQRGVDEGLIRSDVDLEWIRVLLIAPVISTSMTLRPVPTREQLHANVDIVLRGVAP